MRKKENTKKKQMTHIHTLHIHYFFLLLKLLYQARFVEKDNENIHSA